MTSFVPSSIQKRLLRYVLLRTGLLDTQELDLDSLDITLGRQNSIELRNVGLHVQKLSTLLDLPREVRLHTARVSRLHLNIPADLYYGSITARAEGIQCGLALEPPVKEKEHEASFSRGGRQPGSPQHRKTHRRIDRSPPYDPGGRNGKDAVPSTRDLARSFLMEEPAEEIHELTERYQSRAPLAESVTSDFSDDDALGTGAAPGLPGFLAGFLQGIIDRFQLELLDITVKVEIPLAATKSDVERKVTFMLKVERTAVGAVQAGADRHIEVSNIRAYVQGLKDQAVDLGRPTKPVSSTTSDASAAKQLKHSPRASSVSPVKNDISVHGMRGDSSDSHAEGVGSPASPEPAAEPPDPFEIRLGEDNLSWNSRRTEREESASDIWSDSDQPTDLEASASADQYLGGPSRNPPHSRSSHSSPLITMTASHEPDTDTFHAMGVDENMAASMILPRTAFSDSNESSKHSDLIQILGQPSEPSVHQEDLSESRLYTEEEAESLYLSAHGSAFVGSSIHHSSLDDVVEKESLSANGSTSTLAASPVLPRMQASQISNDRGSSDELPTTSPADQSNDGVQVLYIDNINIRVITGSGEVEHNSTSPEEFSASRGQPMPGSFSMYADQSASVRFEDPSLPIAADTSPAHGASLHVEVGKVFFALEYGRINDYLHMAATFSALTNSVKPSESSSGQNRDTTPHQHPRTTTIDSLQFHLVPSAEQYWTYVYSPPSSNSSISLPGSLVSIIIEGSTLEQHIPHSPNDLTLSIQRLRIDIGDQTVLSFSESLHESKRSLARSSCDILIEMTSSTSIISQQVIQYTIQTKQVELAFDLNKFSTTFESYGGLNGLMELSSSFLSTEPDSRPSKLSKKGVRFQDTGIGRETDNTRAKSDVKINARFGGINAICHSKTVTMKLLTSSVKTVARHQYIAATIDSLQLTGPMVNGSDAPKPVEVVVNNFRAEYLFHPTDADLERLLALLTPSKNKYESDEDILIDTLLLQRRKGSVARLTMGTVKARIVDWACIAPAQLFAEELASLSAVAKYLPEDERPGLLTLVRVHEVQAKVPINNTFGSASIDLKDCNVAHIGLPSLTAFALGDVRIGRQGSFDLLHALMPTTPNEEVPMVMARMIGDEVEPTLRLKFFNVCVEYSVPILLALTELGVDIAADQVIDMAASTIADLTAGAAELAISPSSTFSSSAPKRLGVDVLFHQCMVGLQPNGLPCKGMLVIDNAKITTTVPLQEPINIRCELRKANIFVADSPRAIQSSAKLAHVSLAQRLPETLKDMGYVSVCSIMAASIDAKITDDLDSQSKSVEVDFRNDLLFMESCADSTRTLIQTLGALSPPAAPSKEPKFRTEPMSMEEMVSSFTGDAFETQDRPPSTLFDTDTAILPTEDDMLDASMSESIYGGFGDMEDSENDLLLAEDAPMDTAQSLLEDDPFEFPNDPNTAKLSNRDLVKDLNRQLESNAEPSSGPEPWFLSPEQIERLPGESTVLGAEYRFNNPRTEQKPIALTQFRQKLPFKLRVRDVHFIWHLYDGYDWQGTRQTISHAVEEVEHRAEERRMKRLSAADPEDDESIIGDCLFNSIYIGIPAKKDIHDLRRQINRDIDDLASETESYATSGVSKPTNLSAGSGQRGRRGPRRLKLERSRQYKIAFELKGVCADVLVFPPGTGEAQNSLDVRVRDFEIFDNLPTSTWRKFLTNWHTDGSEREIAKPMIHVELTSIRPILDLSATELRMRVTVTPLRLHVDQDALDFITRFFNFKDSSAELPPASEPAFIQRLEVYTVDLLLDYKPKRVDYAGLRSGRYTEFKNFFILDAAHIKLKHTILYGLQGFETLHDTLSDIWTPDVKRNQLPGVLAGLSGISPFVSLGAGIADVVGVPIREYRKDGRIVRSIQKGALHLARNTTSEVARFGARVAVGTHNALVSAEGLFAQPTPHNDDEEDPAARISAYANQPLGVMQGLRSARKLLERDLLTARDALIAVQGEAVEGGSAAAAAAAVARHAPTILLRPVIGATRAVGQTLMGVGNQVDRGNVKRVEDKYKQR